MSEYINESIIDDTALRPHLYDEEVHVSAPAISVIGSYSLPTTLSTGYIDQGSTPSPSIPKTSFSQRTAYIPPNDPVLFSIPESGPVSSGGLRDPDIWYNSDTLIFQPNGTGGGGGSQSLSQVLAIGNSVGAYDIDMNGQQLLSLAQIQAKPGDDFNIINASDDVNLAGANVTFTAGNSVNVNATNMNMGSSKIINVANPSNAQDAATKAYVDGSGSINWSQHPATSDVELAGYQINDVTFLNAPTGPNNPVYVYNPYQLGTTTITDAALIVAGGDNRADVSNNGVGIFTQKNITRGIIDYSLGESIGALVMTGKDTADNDIPYASVRGVATNPTAGSTYGRINFYTRAGAQNLALLQLDACANVISVQGNTGTAIDMNNHFIKNLKTPVLTTDAATKDYVDVSGGASWSSYKATQNVDMSGYKITNLATPTDASGAATKAYVDAAIAGGTQSLAQVLAVGNSASTNIDMSQNSIVKVSDVTNTSGTLNITADDLNLSATGLTSVLNIGSTFGTLITSVGAIDITAGGTTAINSTGNVTIGSLGTTSIENFNLNNSVLTKVPATADLQLNNISKIINNSATIDMSSSSVNVNKFQFADNILSAPGTTRLFLDDVEAVNNDAVGGRIDITSSIVAANNFEFSGSQLASSAADFDLQNIGTLNSSTEGSDIVSKATIVANQTLFSDPTGFKTQLTATTGTAIGFHSDATTATAVGESAIGAYIAGTEANNTDGNAVGLSVQTILGGLSAGNTATGVEVWGSMTGTTKRGFYEHSASSGVVNTFVHPVGIGDDPSGVYMLDVSGQVNITAGVGGRANPVLTLETTSGAAPGAYLQFYHNSTTPAGGDRAGVMDMYANNASATKYEVARIRTIQQDITAGAENGSIELWATDAGTITHYMDIDGSENAVVINPEKNIAGTSFKIYDSTGVTTNNVLMNADCSNANVMFKNYPQRYIFDICNNYTLTLPNAFNTMRILAFGAGGGGGSGRKGTSSCFGGGAGAGGNGVEVWYDRQELLADASGSITLYITPGKGGDGGAAVSTAATNGNNGSAGGTTYVNLNGFGAGATQRLIPDTATAGGNGGSGGTGAAGTGGTAATFSSDRNIGSQGRAGASSSITAQPTRNTTALLYNGSTYSQTGGSGAGGGIDSAGTTQYAGGIFVSPVGQKYNGLGANVNKGGAAGTAGGTPGGAGSIVTFDNILSAAVKPLAGMGSLMGGGGASIGGNGGAGGGWTYGTAGSRGDGGGGGGATGNASSVPSGAGGRGADGFVYITIW
jgi:hypothetical protein